MALFPLFQPGENSLPLGGFGGSVCHNGWVPDLHPSAIRCLPTVTCDRSPLLTIELARIASDGPAKLVQRHPDRFAAGIATRNP